MYSAVANEFRWRKFDFYIKICLVLLLVICIDAGSPFSSTSMLDSQEALSSSQSAKTLIVIFNFAYFTFCVFNYHFKLAGKSFIENSEIPFISLVLYY